MWLWDCTLRELRFRRKAERYWQCERYYQLPAHGHISIFSWSEQTLHAARGKAHRYLVEVTEFHVTYRIGLERIHFYYHEAFDNEWHPAEHSSSNEIRLVGGSPRTLRAQSDAIAAAFVAELGGTFRARRKRR